MKFHDLSKWDLNLIKSNAATMLVTETTMDRYEVLVNATLTCVHAKGFDLIPRSNDLIKRLIDYVTPEWLSPKNTPPDEVIAKIFTYLSLEKIDIVRDDTREVTWSTPRDSWYDRTPKYKKPWVF